MRRTDAAASCSCPVKPAWAKHVCCKSSRKRSRTAALALVVSGQCDAYIRRPFAPVAAALAGLAQRNARVLETLDPRVRAVLEAPHVAANDCERFASFATFLWACCARKTVVMLLEDVQHAGVETFALLAYIARRISRERCLIVATYRPEEVEHQSAAMVALARLLRQASVSRLELPPLSPAGIRALIELTLRGHDTPAASVLQQIEQRADGNPLIAEELVKHSIAGGDGADIPLTVKGMLRERLLPLAADEMYTLQLAAVVGRRFDAALLAMSSGENPARIEDILTHACRRNVLVRDGRFYAFRYALLRDLMCEHVAPRKARELHASIAQSLERDGRGESTFSDLAYHWSKARDGAKAAKYGERAGDEAMSAGAYDEAVQAYERVVDVESGAPRAQLFEKLGKALACAGYADRATAAYLRAAGIYRDGGMLQNMARAYVHSRRTQYVDDAPAARRSLSEFARELSLHSDVRVRSRALVLLAVDHAHHLEIDDLFATLARVNEADLADTDARIRLHDARAFGYVLAGSLNDWHAEAQRLLRAAQASSEPEHLATAHSNLAIEAMNLGEPASAQWYFDRALSLARSHKLDAILSYTLAAYAMQNYFTGHLREARTAVDEARGVRPHWLVTRVYLAISAMSIGLASGEARFANDFAPDVNMDAAFRTGLSMYYARFAGPYAQLLLRDHSAERAREVLELAIARSSGLYGGSETWPIAAQIVGERYVQILRERFAAARDVAAGNRVARATQEMFEARVAARTGDAAAAAARASAAADLYRAIGWPLFEQRARSLVRAASSTSHNNGVAAAALTPREEQVAHLAARGTPNGRIASELHITERTVEKHLTSAFKKYGARSRTELAHLLLTVTRGGEAVTPDP